MLIMLPTQAMLLCTLVGEQEYVYVGKQAHSGENKE